MLLMAGLGILIIFFAGRWIWFDVFRVHILQQKHSLYQRSAPYIFWTPPDTSTLPHTAEGDLIRYGRLLIVHTARYLGPKGKIAHISNGMNCQNCHLAAGTLPFANNFSLVASTYPKYRARNDRVETVAFRVNACLKRSLNGEALDTHSREMKAFVAYLSWIGGQLHARISAGSQTQKVWGSGTEKLKYLKRAADTGAGRLVFMTYCQNCHGPRGEGLWVDSTGEYQYPPLWGKHSYNTGAGMYRISQFAAFVKNNMPYGTSYLHPQLTDDQAWDVAAFVNSQPRQAYRDLKYDWPKIADKPVDYPFGPYADSFQQQQHKYGPFEEIEKSRGSISVKQK
ncbi:thiosulfate dehydrogenase [Thermoflavifilum aggregans]|uniref:Thiosulfate dehydrogenase n=2 Tax=Thermoflavifilum aggregans TaxID=454188 RepID=A0A2M9CW63_9BACT|nr:thiosulfate dehydrogenase [Thermoflavifilum aggregans]